jgi:hypothetical protein
MQQQALESVPFRPWIRCVVGLHAWVCHPQHEPHFSRRLQERASRSSFSFANTSTPISYANAGIARGLGAPLPYVYALPESPCPSPSPHCRLLTTSLQCSPPSDTIHCSLERPTTCDGAGSVVAKCGSAWSSAHGTLSSQSCTATSPAGKGGAGCDGVVADEGTWETASNSSPIGTHYIQHACAGQKVQGGGTRAGGWGKAGRKATGRCNWLLCGTCSMRVQHAAD